jgi:hexokinase
MSIAETLDRRFFNFLSGRSEHFRDTARLATKIHESFGIPEENISVEDAQVVKVIAHAIGTRAAKLAGMAIGAVIIQSRLLDPTLAEAASHGDVEEKLIDVAVDGSMVEHYPGFELYSVHEGVFKGTRSNW